MRIGSYPGAFALRDDLARWSAYVRDAIVEPAIGRDLLALAAVRKPALLRQVFARVRVLPGADRFSAEAPGPAPRRWRARDHRALSRAARGGVSRVAARKHSARASRRRSAPPKLVTLNNALLAAVDPRGIPDPTSEPARFGAWVENACLAHAWNSGQRVTYWREEPLEVDGVLDGSWGSWAIEVKTGPVNEAELRGLLEFNRRHSSYRPLLVCDTRAKTAAARAGIDAIAWRDFLLAGPPGVAPQKLAPSKR